MAVVKVPVSKVITGHKALRAALRDTETYSSDLQGDADVRDYRQYPLEVDPPRHHLYRAALAPFFVKPAIEKLEPQFRANTKKLFQDFLANPDQEIIANLILPIVMHNLGTIYNRPQDVAEWISWGPDVWTATGAHRDGSVLHAYIDRVYAECKDASTTDIWQQIANLKIGDEVISYEEFKGVSGVMLAGGRDTVVKFLAGILWYFAENPEEKVLLQNQPEHLDNAVNEFLRYFTPLPAMARTTHPETGATDLPADRYVSMNFLSGNFDEEVFPNPTKVELTRARNPHLAFGFGPHTCIGNHLAEFEARIFITEILDFDFNWKVDSKSEITYLAAPLDTVPNLFHSLFITLPS